MTRIEAISTISYFTIVFSSCDADLSFDQTTHQRLFFLQVIVADNTNSKNNNAIDEITHYKINISLSECIIFFSVFTAECVAIVTVNLISIILFIKKKSPRTRSMYLVMSLTMADLLVGNFRRVLIVFFFFCPKPSLSLCKMLFFIWGSWNCISCSYPFLSFCLPDKHCCDFCRAISRYVSSIEASAHQEMGIRCSNCCCLGFSCHYISHCGDKMVSDDTPPALLGGIIRLFVIDWLIDWLIDR